MSEPSESIRDDDAPTLDPPGSIAVVGAGPMGIEAALYGRYLGYDVSIFEAHRVGSSMQDRLDEPLPVLPGRCLSPLALSAMEAQVADSGSGASRHGLGPDGPELPMTFRDWIGDWLEPLTATDLLAGRLHTGTRVERIETIEVEFDTDSADEDDDVPPDFRITLEGGRAIDIESVILATGPAHHISLGFTPPVPYFFTIEATDCGDPERDLRAGHRQIVSIFAILRGRDDLDLYRPRRG